MNEKLRQKKLARNKKKREHHNKVRSHRERCESGSRFCDRKEKEYNDSFDKLKNEMGL
jgi:hypothetical protein